VSDIGNIGNKGKLMGELDKRSEEKKLVFLCCVVFLWICILEEKKILEKC